MCPWASFISFICLFLCTFCSSQRNCISLVSSVLLYSFVLICAPLYCCSRKFSASFTSMCICAVSPSCLAMEIASRISLYCFCFCPCRCVAMVCVCLMMFCLRSFHSSETFSLSSSISKSSRCVCMSLCMWDVYILFSDRVLLNFQCGDLFFCVGCGVLPMPMCAITPLWSVNFSVSSMCFTCPMCRSMCVYTLSSLWLVFVIAEVWVCRFFVGFACRVCLFVCVG